MRKLLIVVWLLPLTLNAQDDLLSEIDDGDQGSQYVTAVFKGLKVVNFESTKLVAEKELTFIVAHRFGSLKNGIDTFFGLDDAVTRLNFVYGIKDWINIGVSRSSFQKIYQGSLKYRVLRQERDGFPFTIVGYNAIIINTGLDSNNLPLIEFKHRVGYTVQVLVSHKVSTDFSVLLAPTFFHDNYVAINEQDNSQYALGIGARYKFAARWSVNVDYGYHFNRADSSPFRNPLSIGVDLETGGHVFQMHFTNAQPMNTNAFLGQSTGDWSDGDVYFGFNLSRRF